MKLWFQWIVVVVAGVVAVPGLADSTGRSGAVYCESVAPSPQGFSFEASVQKARDGKLVLQVKQVPDARAEKRSFVVAYKQPGWYSPEDQLVRAPETATELEGHYNAFPQTAHRFLSGATSLIVEAAAAESSPATLLRSGTRVGYLESPELNAGKQAVVLCRIDPSELD